MADEESPDKDALLEKVEAVLDCIQPVYKSENFDSLKQVNTDHLVFTVVFFPFLKQQ
jgi:hypothetical protein